MNWKTTLNKGNRSDKWTDRKAARQAHGWVYDTHRWMNTDQAALMKYVPEQDRAFRWWDGLEGNEENTADVKDILPKWVEGFHNVPIDHSMITDDPTDLSPTAQLLRQLCQARARQMASGAIATCSPSVLSLLATLSHGGEYSLERSLDVSGLPAKSGTIVFPLPVTRRCAENYEALLPEAPETQLLRAVTWQCETLAGVERVRCMDWTDISGGNASTGNATLDKHVTEALKDQGLQMPPMMFNGEWVTDLRPAAADVVSEARTRVIEAAAYKPQGAWRPGSVLEDSPRPVAVRLLAALSDASAAGLLSTETVGVPSPGTRKDPTLPAYTSVTVYKEPE